MSRVRALILVAVWGLLVGIGFFALFIFDTAPGDSSPAPAEWPQHTSAMREPGKFSLVMFLHPRCFCSNASLYELSKLVTRYDERLSATVLFYVPETRDTTWITSPAWVTARAIPGVTVSADASGREAAHFGGLTSGAVVLYDPRGKLVFSGGITATRGHIGDNAGSAAVAALLDGHDAMPRSPVFGCHITDSGTSSGGLHERV